MAKKKTKEENDVKEPTVSFDYKEHIIKTFDKPRGFLYYLISNKISPKSKDEVVKAYDEYKKLGGI